MTWVASQILMHRHLLSRSTTPPKYPKQSLKACCPGVWHRQSRDKEKSTPKAPERGSQLLMVCCNHKQFIASLTPRLSKGGRVCPWRLWHTLGRVIGQDCDIKVSSHLPNQLIHESISSLRRVQHVTTHTWLNWAIWIQHQKKLSKE